MKKLLLLLAMGAFVITSAFAQNMPKRGAMMLTPEQIAQRQTNIMKHRLELTADQEKKVYEINLKYAQDQAKLRQVARDQRLKMVQTMLQKDSLVKNVLTPEQRKIYMVYNQMQRNDMKNNQANRPMGNRPMNKRQPMMK